MNNSRNVVRIVCIILAALFVIPMLIAAIVSLTGCSTVRADLVPYEELVENIVRPGVSCYISIPDNFKGLWSSYEDGNPPAAAVKVEVLSCRNFCEYIVQGEYEDRGKIGHFDGHTEYEIRITDVAEEYNTLGVKRGQKKRLYQYNHIRFDNIEDTLALFSEKLGKQITDLAALHDAGGGEVELAPVKGKEYEFCVFDNEFPMKVGESYTMLLRDNSGEDDKDKFYGVCICPAYDNIIPARFAREHGFCYDFAQAAASLSLLFED